MVAIDLARIFSRLDRNARKLEFAAQAVSFYAKAFASSATPPVTRLKTEPLDSCNGPKHSRWSDDSIKWWSC